MGGHLGRPNGQDASLPGSEGAEADAGRAPPGLGRPLSRSALAKAQADAIQARAAQAAAEEQVAKNEMLQAAEADKDMRREAWHLELGLKRDVNGGKQCFSMVFSKDF